MTSSSDVRDVLNIQDGAAGGPRPTKKQRLAGPRPNLKGLAREVHNLGGDNPIAIVPQVSQFKKRRLANRKPATRWEMRPFRNSARDDGTLILRHWRRKDTKQELHQGLTPAPAATVATEGDVAAGAQKQEDGQTQPGVSPAVDEMEDSAFAKYNVHVSVPQYTDEQYQQTLQNGDWTKEETDYLMELAGDFDLRWPLIWDRYEWNPPATNGSADADGDESKAIVPTVQTRAMEDLKARYYEVAAKMMAVHKPVQYMSQPEYALHEIMAHYNPQQEKARKEFATNSLNRSREEAREEESLLLEIKRILARGERFNEERRELYNRLDYPHGDTDISTFKSSTGLQTLLQNLMNVDKSKKRKSILGGIDTASPAGQSTPQAAAASQEPAPTKKEAAAAAAAAAAANNRESIGATSTPTGAGKKGAQQTPTERRKLTEQEEALYGVTHHDRLGSGPTFRTEKINKLFSHKSNQQQLRINNTLNELDVPVKLAMPTSATTQQFEALLAAVNGLLDARKVSDKLEAEIKIELAKKAEREKKNNPEGEQTAVGEGEGEGEKKDGEAENAEANAEAAESSTEDASKEAQAEATVDGAEQKEGEEENAEEETPATAAAAAESEKEKEKEKERPGSRGPPHKRSASVLSTMSDKSAKRQKK